MCLGDLMDENRNAIGIYIRESREKKGVTQMELSARLEVREIYLSASSIGKIENGTRPINDLQIIGIAEALQVKPEWFFMQLTRKN